MNQYKTTEHSDQLSNEKMNVPQPIPMGLVVRRIIIGLGFAGAVVLTGLPLWQTYQQQTTYEKQLEQAKVEKEQAVQQNRDVFQVTQQLKDPNYLEDVARRDYYYTKPGEIIFELGQDANDGVFNQGSNN